jgi:alpha-tubulin suppressor-like RCC1 family protein
VTGVGGVPGSGVSAVVLNVTVTETTAGGYLTVSPTGTARPTASNLNWSGGGTTIPNAVTVKVGTGGKIDLYQSGPGTAQVIVDVAGYYLDGTVTEPGGFSSLTPARILDTRSTGGALAAAESRDLQVTGAGGVPASTVSAVVLNVTVTATTAGGYLSVFPAGTSKPTVSNLNWSAGATIPNQVIVKIGDAGKISLFQSGPGTAQVIVDVAGYFVGGTATQPGMFVALSPARVLDTRSSGAVAGGADLKLAVLGKGGLPVTGVAAVVVNTTVTETTAGGYLTVYPGTSPLPTASNLNWNAPGTTIPNLVTVKTGTDGSIKFHNGSPGTTQIIADIAGYYLAAPGSTHAATTVTAGGEHTCALTTAGGVKCWGWNGYGQLGDGTLTYRLTPVDVSGLTSGVTAISAGNYHTCALTIAGGVKCWGRNAYGELGDGTSTDRSTPVDVSGLTSGVAAITVAAYYTCALTTAGGVKCWGYNAYGELGDGTTTNTQATPVDVSGLTSGVSAITAGGDHSCALTTVGGVKCWGDNSYGWLGDGTNTNRWTPVNVSGLTSGATTITASNYHTCALINGGGAKCWGDNTQGELGDGTTSDRWTPVDVSGLTSGVTAITAGSEHTCAVTTASGVKCWGFNLQGELGDGTTTQRDTPVDVSSLTSGVTAITAGDSHTCAVTTAGGVKCWGWNGWAQLGDGTTTWRSVPVDVTGLTGTP